MIHWFQVIRHKEFLSAWTSVYGPTNIIKKHSDQSCLPSYFQFYDIFSYCYNKMHNLFLYPLARSPKNNIYDLPDKNCLLEFQLFRISMPQHYMDCCFNSSIMWDTHKWRCSFKMCDLHLYIMWDKCKHWEVDFCDFYYAVSIFSTQYDYNFR